MTLVELLVGAIMAFLIITPMLGFVVDMLNTDRGNKSSQTPSKTFRPPLISSPKI
jgi:hypothetical protein